MKHTVVLAVCSGAVLALPAVQIYQHDIAPSSSVVAQAQHPSLALPTAPLTRRGQQYYIDIEIGYPPFPVSLSVDTGSGDTWVNAACQNCSFKPYNVSASESSVLIHKDILFYEEYEPPELSKVTGFYVSDFFDIANNGIQNISFGVANETGPVQRNDPGILALGPDGAQMVSQQTGQRFDSVLDRMKSQRVTETASFGLHLGGQSFDDYAMGELTFGGFNPLKVSGSLLPLPLVASPDQYARIQVILSGISVVLKGQTLALRPESGQVLGTSVNLDNGTPTTTIPSSMYYELIGLLHAEPDRGMVDCDYYFSGDGLEFTFLGFGGTSAKIWVPFRYFIARDSKQNLCWLSLAQEFDCSWGTDTRMSCSVLGADFLRAAYLYVNYDNSTVSLGQAAYERPFLESPAVDSTGHDTVSNLALLRQI